MDDTVAQDMIAHGASAINQYLDLMDAQREEIIARLAGITQEALWRRPEPGEWSMGESLDHTRVLNNSFVALFKVCWVLLWPIARLRRNKPYPVEIDNVYQRPGFPMGVGWIWTPRHKATRPLPLSRLAELLAETHGRIRRFYAGQDPRLLGHLPLYDPVIGTLNLIQALRVGVYHDDLHYDVVRRQIEGSQDSSQTTNSASGA